MRTGKGRFVLASQRDGWLSQIVWVDKLQRYGNYIRELYGQVREMGDPVKKMDEKWMDISLRNEGHS